MQKLPPLPQTSRYKMTFNSTPFPSTAPVAMENNTRNLISICLLLSLTFVVSSASARRPSESGRTMRLSAKQCQLESFTSSQPSYRMESDGGLIEMWDPMDDHFQCAGAAAMKMVITPKSLSLPKFFPFPRLAYIIQGKGMVGINCPGCPETYESEQTSMGGGRTQMGGSQERHQKIHRVRRGDIVAIPAGASHWSYNDGNEDLVSVSVFDINGKNNHLDQTFRAFMLSGGQSSRQESSARPRGSRGQSQKMLQDTFQNVLSALDEELLAESFNVGTDVVRRMKQNDGMGLIMKCNEDMSMIKPDDEEAQEMSRRSYGRGSGRMDNGIEETMCSMKVRYNMEAAREADYYTRDAGRINLVNEQKLPILSLMDMSAERGTLMPNAMYTPHWSMTDMRMVYALRGDMELQMVDDNGNTVMEQRVKEGDMFVIPEFYVTLARAGSEGCDYISFKTCSKSMQSPMAGSLSMMRAMPVDVIANSYQVSPSQAMQLKMNRDPQTMLFTPTSRMSRS